MEDETGSLGNRVTTVFPVLPAWPMNVVQRLTAVCAETERIKHDEEAQALALIMDEASSIWPLALAPTFAALVDEPAASYGVAFLLGQGTGPGARVALSAPPGPPARPAWPDAAEFLRFWLRGETRVEIPTARHTWVFERS